MDNVYYNGDLIPEKDWDYELSKPKEVSTTKNAPAKTVAPAGVTATEE